MAADDASREALIERLRVAMLGTTDGDFIDPECDIPAGEMFRLAVEWVDAVVLPLVRERDRLAAERAKWRAEALDQVRADIRAEAMIRTYSDPRTFTALEVFDLAKRYTPEWAAKVLSDRIEKGADRG